MCLSPPRDRPGTLRPAHRAAHHTAGTAAGRWPVRGHDGQQVSRQPLKGGRLAGIELPDKLLDGGLPPDQDLHRDEPPGLCQMQG
jgi:hypothetical protein